MAFSAGDSYLRAFMVGILNTVKVAALGIILATFIGTLIGIARLSQNWLVARMASVYVETVRNVPLLLQLYFWYAFLTSALPLSKQAFNPLPGFYLSKSGLRFPVPADDPIHLWTGLAVLAGVVAAVLFYRWARRRQEATGEQRPLLLPCLGIVVGLPLLVWLVGGAPTAMDSPEWAKFGYQGGAEVTPEFMALLFGLTLYTAGFIAEIVRSGILAVSWGQSEAAMSLGLRRGFVLRLVILPQALRVIIPPMTSQFLNLAKNSSLAVAIGYPDVVSIANTTLNQEGQAIECISIIMLVYLTISLSIAAYMNWYNKRIALVER